MHRHLERTRRSSAVRGPRDPLVTRPKSTIGRGTGPSPRTPRPSRLVLRIVECLARTGLPHCCRRPSQLPRRLSSVVLLRLSSVVLLRRLQTSMRLATHGSTRAPRAMALPHAYFVLSFLLNLPNLQHLTYCGAFQDVDAGALQYRHLFLPYR